MCQEKAKKGYAEPRFLEMLPCENPMQRKESGQQKIIALRLPSWVAIVEIDKREISWSGSGYDSLLDMRKELLEFY